MSSSTDSDSSSDSLFSRLNLGLSLKTDKKKESNPLDYISLLNSAYSILEKSQVDSTMRLPLKVTRRTRKTFVNTSELASILNRDCDHLKSFLSKELVAVQSPSKDDNLVLNGSFMQHAIEKQIKRYVEAFVLCKSCKSFIDTEIIKINKLFYLKCNKCQSKVFIGNSLIKN